ncbi:MAG TPA: cytochrome b N-terminal domain-containing protein [Gemmataceae bacterium]|nr:cytochrome b N-terminal domain-containing protein [Gemmataceae bacterium]
MFARLNIWLDHRTGYHGLVKALLIEHIPGGARWRYVWGSCLAFVFSVQLVTGVLLMTAYSPSASTAWSSVYFIQYEMDFGWLIRGLHHFGSQAMVVLLGIHMLQVVIAGAHLPPREVNWWLGLALLGCVLGLSLTGYLLPWDQKGYWATQVATNIAGNLPVLGPWQQKIIVGGPVYGHHTLTRFFTLHVAVLPPLVILLTIAHLTVFRRHGVTAPVPAVGEGWFWPDQAFRDLLVSILLFGVLLVLVLWGHGHAIAPTDASADSPSLYARIAHGGRDGWGANLDAPADPARPYPARPEWYFLFLFQLLKYFEGKQEIIGTVVIPTAAALLLAVLPLLGYGRMRIVGRIVGVLVLVGLLAGVMALTCLALADDTVNPVSRMVLSDIATRAIPLIAALFLLHLVLLAVLPPTRLRRIVGVIGLVLLVGLALGSSGLAYTATKSEVPSSIAQWVEQRLGPEQKAPSQSAEKFHEELEQADRLAERAVQLASAGVPAEGAHLLLRRDPLIQGKELFGQHCGVCHSHGSDFENAKPTASDLAGFGSERWIVGLLREPDSSHYFGSTPLRTMSSWVRKSRARAKKEGDESKLEAEFARIAGWLGSHPRKDPPAEQDQSPFALGYRAFADRCTQCHTYKQTGGGDAKGPDFTGYGDADWLRLMIMTPYHGLRYGSRNKMPAFRDLEGPTAAVSRQEIEQARDYLLKDQLLARNLKEDDAQAEELKKEIDGATKLIHLSDIDRELIIRWLLGDYRVVFGGEPVAAAPEPGTR